VFWLDLSFHKIEDSLVGASSLHLTWNNQLILLCWRFLALEQSDGILEGKQLDEVLQSFTDEAEEMTEDQLR
jgi:hypothetical protein